MLYSILVYSVPGVFDQLPEEQQQAAIDKHHALQHELAEAKALGPVAQLMGTESAVTVRQQGDQTLVLDGPFAETKEHFLGFYVLECDSLEDAIAAAKKLPLGIAAYEVRPVQWVPDIVRMMPTEDDR